MTKAAPRYVKITFKPNEEWIYDEIQKHSGKANWVKDVLADHIKKEQQKENAGTRIIEDDFSIFGE